MENNLIKGSPSKAFFIGMITRDITIKDAILDLLDNSIDGASRINPLDYSGLFIELTISNKEFLVKDNCGGFSLKIAKDYAFRFGRPDDIPETTGSVGRFGIGMKRSLFKMGKKFEVESKTYEDHFEVNIDVLDWKDKRSLVKQEDGSSIEIDDWDFRYENIRPETCNLNECGTFIKVTDLYEEVAELFDNSYFLNDLSDDIERLLNFSLEKNIKISLNNKVLRAKNIKIFTEQSTPYFHEGHKDNVKFKVIAGLGDIGIPVDSGWYIYCNDRLVLEGDKSEITGWGTLNLPKWHIDYVMFRGIVFMDSPETINLPLTTTKKGVDATADIYKTVLFFMREAIANVIPFLKDVTKLGNEANNYRKLLSEQENKISVVEMKNSIINNMPRKFIAPELDQDTIAMKKDTVRISYDLKKSVANTVKDYAQAKTYKELGEFTFNYYVKMEDVESE